MSVAVYAAGALIWRRIDGKIHILVVHRTQYGDVTIPKGKVDPGESLPQTAVREMAEETGLSVTLGVPLGISRYQLANGRDKVVHYWAAKATKRAVQRSSFVPNSEISGLEWVTIKHARSYLSYPHDVEILETFAAIVAGGVTDTFALVLMRHGKAEARHLAGRDTDRHLTERGQRQAEALVDVVAAWSPRKILSSPALRCVETVSPLAEAMQLSPTLDEGMSQAAFEAGEAELRRIIGKRVRAKKNAVLCSHGPVLPELLRELALATATPQSSALRDAGELDTGAFSIVHLSKKHPAGGIVTIESYPAQA